MQVYAKDLDIELIDISGQVNSTEYKTINPIQKIPALVIGGQVIPDSSTICEYLEEEFSDLPLLPNKVIDKALMRSIIQISDQYILKPAISLFPQRNPQIRDNKVIEKGVSNIKNGLGWLQNYRNKYLPFTVNGSLNLADCTLVPTFFTVTMVTDFLQISNPLDDYSQIRAYWKAIQNNKISRKILTEMTEAKNNRFKS
jgi:glutathione S-transferase